MKQEAHRPLVSIITPSYNQADYLEQTIHSVLAQDWPALEYIIVDGASTDKSPEIIQRYADRLAWWVSEPDEGQASAINKGLQKAQGEIVAWLNSDDLYLPGAVSTAVAVLVQNPELGLAFGDAITIDSQGAPLNSLAFGDWGLKELIAFRIICQPAVFMRRRVLEQAGSLGSDYHYMLDHHLWIRMARLAPVKHIPQVMAAARHHAGAKNVSQAPGFGQETLRLLDWMQTQPDLAPLMKANRKQIDAGAYRLNGRYLLDGGLPGPALKSYSRALLANPDYTLKHWHRMLYALFSLLGASGLADWYYRLKFSTPGRQPDLSNLPGIESWPGLAVSNKSR